MSTDTFAVLGDIPGEATAEGYEGQTEVLAWATGVRRDLHQDGESFSGHIHRDALSLTTFVDKGTPAVLKHLAERTKIPEITVTVRDGNSKDKLLTLKAEEVTIYKYSTGGSGGESRLTQNLSLHFQKLSVINELEGTEHMLDFIAIN